MKTTTNYFFPFSKSLVCALTLTAVFSSCKKDKEVEPPVITLPANLAMVHAAPGVADLDFFIDKTKANKDPFNYNKVISYQSITQPGKKELSITKKGETAVLVKLATELAPNKSYSAFVGDKTANAIVLVEDDLTAPKAGEAKIRFINLSPDAGTLDLAVTGKAEALIAKKAFKESSLFINIGVPEEINFEIRENGKPTVLATLPKVKIEKGKIYTIWAKGLKAGPKDGAGLGIAVMTNK